MVVTAESDMGWSSYTRVYWVYTDPRGSTPASNYKGVQIEPPWGTEYLVYRISMTEIIETRLGLLLDHRSSSGVFFFGQMRRCFRGHYLRFEVALCGICSLCRVSSYPSGTKAALAAFCGV